MCNKKWTYKSIALPILQNDLWRSLVRLQYRLLALPSIPIAVISIWLLLRPWRAVYRVFLRSSFHAANYAHISSSRIVCYFALCPPRLCRVSYTLWSNFIAFPPLSAQCYRIFVKVLLLHLSDLLKVVRIWFARALVANHRKLNLLRGVVFSAYMIKEEWTNYNIMKGSNQE